MDDVQAMATPIVPCTDLDSAQAWWGRLGFTVDSDYGDYRILGDGGGAWVHLTATVPGWLVPGRNPYGVYVYTPRVDALAGALRDDIIEPGRAAEDKPWGMREFSLNGPDGVLVRVGWPIDRTPP